MSDVERASAASSRRRFLKQAGALVAAAPVVAALEATARVEPAGAAEAKKPAGDPFAAARPDVSIARNAEERAALEKQWKGMQDVLDVVRKASLDPSVEPAAAFAAVPRPPRDRRARAGEDDDRDGEG